MCIFEYESKAGKRIERVYRVGRAPRRVKVRGVAYEKVPSIPAAPLVDKLRVTSHQIPANHPALERGGTLDGRSNVCFDTRAKVTEFCAASKDTSMPFDFGHIPDRPPAPPSRAEKIASVGALMDQVAAAPNRDYGGFSG